MAEHRPVRIGVEVNRSKAGAASLVRDLHAVAHSFPGLEFLWEKHTGALIRQRGFPLELLRRKADLLLVAGGDGSILQTVRHVYPAKVPILGVNIGSLGFLTSLAQTELFDSLPVIAARKLRSSPRMALEGIIRRGGKQIVRVPCALNDVVVSRGEKSQLVRLRVYCGEIFVTDYVCDGLIVCTPTGSTAYSVSANGPIIAPDARVLGLTPICSHSLTQRSLMVGPEKTVRIEVPPQHSPVIVQFDGVSYGKLRPGDRLEVRPAKNPVVLASLPGRDFFSVLRQKLKWGSGSA